VAFVYVDQATKQKNFTTLKTTAQQGRQFSTKAQGVQGKFCRHPKGGIRGESRRHLHSLGVKSLRRKHDAILT